MDPSLKQLLVTYLSDEMLSLTLSRSLMDPKSPQALMMAMCANFSKGG